MPFCWNILLSIFFPYFHVQKKYRIRLSVLWSVFTKKIFAFKVYILSNITLAYLYSIWNIYLWVVSACILSSLGAYRISSFKTRGYYYQGHSNVHIFWEGHNQIIGGDFEKFSCLLRIYELYIRPKVKESKCTGIIRTLVLF